MSDIRIIDVPLDSRIETGPLQFNDDWPGTFIRGKHACHYAMVLGLFLDNPDTRNPIYESVLRGLQSDLASSNINPAVASMLNPGKCERRHAIPVIPLAGNTTNEEKPCES